MDWIHKGIKNEKLHIIWYCAQLWWWQRWRRWEYENCDERFLALASQPVEVIDGSDNPAVQVWNRSTHVIEYMKTASCSTTLSPTTQGSIAKQPSKSNPSDAICQRIRVAFSVGHSLICPRHCRILHEANGWVCLWDDPCVVGSRGCQWTPGLHWRTANLLASNVPSHCWWPWSECEKDPHLEKAPYEGFSPSLQQCARCIPLDCSHQENLAHQFGGVCCWKTPFVTTLLGRKDPSWWWKTSNTWNISKDVAESVAQAGACVYLWNETQPNRFKKTKNAKQNNSPTIPNCSQALSQNTPLPLVLWSCCRRSRPLANVSPLWPWLVDDAYLLWARKSSGQLRWRARSRWTGSAELPWSQHKPT